MQRVVQTMIDLNNLTRFDRTDYELQEFMLFCIASANQGVLSSVEALHGFLATAGVVHYTPFEYIRSISKNSPFGKSLEETLRLFGFSNCSKTARAFSRISSASIDLRTCDSLELQAAAGIWPSTARFFIANSR